MCHVADIFERDDFSYQNIGYLAKYINSASFRDFYFDYADGLYSRLLEIRRSRIFLNSIEEELEHLDTILENLSEPDIETLALMAYLKKYFHYNVSKDNAENVKKAIRRLNPYAFVNNINSLFDTLAKLDAQLAA